MTSPRDGVKPKKLGFCPITGEQLFDIRTQYPQGHALEGEAIKLGKPAPTAYRATLLLISGSTTDVTLSAEGVERLAKDPSRFVDLHHINCATMVREEISRPFKTGGFVRKKDEAEKVWKSIRAYADNPPIGMLACRPWQDVAKDMVNG